MALRLGSNYAGLVMAPAPSLSHVDWELEPGATAWRYLSPGRHLAIVLGGEHTEPVLAWLRQVGEIPGSSSQLLPILASSAATPPIADCYLLRIPLERYEGAVEEVVRTDGAFAMVSFAATEVLVLCPSSIGIRICDVDRSLADRTLLGLSAVPERHCGPPVVRHVARRTTYDPLGAQIGETRSRALETFDGRITEAASWLVKLVGSGANARLAQHQQRMHEEVQRASANVANPDPVVQRAALGQFDLIAKELNRQISRLDALIRQFRQHSPLPDPWERPSGFQEQGEQLALRAVGRVVDEARARVGAPIAQCPIISVLDDELTIYQEIFRWWPSFDHPMEPLALVSFPRRFTFRAGALPLLGYAVAYTNPELHHATDDLLRRLGRLHPRTLLLGDQPLATASSSYSEYESVGNSVEELLADLVGCLTLGPAYLFALARFATGELSSAQADRLALGVRVRGCLDLLDEMCPSTPFESRFMAEPSLPSIAMFAEAARNLVERPYTQLDHARALEVQTALQAGAIVDAPPSVVINALWDGVSRRAQYVNESAVVLSVIGKASGSPA